MKKLLLILVILFSGCGKQTYESISPQQAYDIINNQEVIILDVREEFEYRQGHLADSVNIPVDELIDRFILEVTDDKNKIIILYCKSGSRAITGAETLIGLGFKNVYTFGGIDDWNYEIVK